MTPDFVARLDSLVSATFESGISKYEYSPRGSRFSTPDSKWRAVSCLQKSIRRGDFDRASKFAEAFINSEMESYFYYRMAVIALEDVGAANPDLVSQFMWAVRNKRRRDALGPVKVAAYFAESFSRSVKDRNACDLLVIADWLPGYDDQREEYLHASEDALVDVAKNNTDVVSRTLALWYLLGTDKFQSPVLPPKSGNKNLFIETYENLEVPELSIYNIFMGMSRQREGHPITLGLTTLYAKDSVEFTCDDLVNLETTGPYLSAAIDGHTQEGKRAFAYFAKVSKPVTQFFESRNYSWDQKLTALKSIVFRLEGHQVDRRLAYPMSNQIQDLTDLAFQTSGCPENPSDGEELMELVRADLPLLGKARQRVCAGLL